MKRTHKFDFYKHLVRLALGVARRPVLTLVISALVLTVCVYLAVTRLEQTADQNELFNPKSPFFRDYLDYVQKFPENEAVFVVIRPRAATGIPGARWMELSERITQKLTDLKQHVVSVQNRVPVEQLGNQGILLADWGEIHKQVAQAKEFLPLIKIAGTAPGLDSVLLGRQPLERTLRSIALAPKLDDDTQRFTSVLLTGVEISLRDGLAVGVDLAALDSTSNTQNPARAGYFIVADNSTPPQPMMLIKVFPKYDYASRQVVVARMQAIRQAVKDCVAGYPELQAGLTGRPVLEADELDITDRDFTLAEALAMVTIFIALIIAFRSFWLALLVKIGLAVGVGWTVGWATLTVGRLSLLSMVFVVALIGIGMDYLIQVIARYRYEVYRRHSQQAIFAHVYRNVGPPIVTTCAGAAGAFLIAVLGDFRGAQELGIIAGGGLFLCLLSAYTILPALLVLVPIRIPATKRIPAPARTLAPTVRARHWIGPAIWLVLLCAAIPTAFYTRFDSNLIKLQPAHTEAVELVNKMNTWYSVVLDRDLNALRRVRAQIITAPVVAGTDSLLDAQDKQAFLTKELAAFATINWQTTALMTAQDLASLGAVLQQLQIRLARMAPSSGNTELTALCERVIIALKAPDKPQDIQDIMTAWQRGYLAALRGGVAMLIPPPLQIQDLPVAVREHYVSPDGTYALYINPRADLWDTEALATFVTTLEPLIPKNSTHTGIAVNIHHATGNIRSAFILSSGLAVGLIILLVWLDVRNLRQTLAAVSVLFLGLPVLLGAMVWMGQTWNFANFFALPILIGAAHEYGVFMIHRYREAKATVQRRWLGWDVADSALFLCALVTITAFAFLMLAEHRGIASLGFIMAGGATCIYLATLLVLRPILRWRLELADRKKTNPKPLA